MDSRGDSQRPDGSHAGRMEEQDLGHLEFFSCRKFDLNSKKNLQAIFSHMVCWLENSSSIMFPAMKSSMACLMTPDRKTFFDAGDDSKQSHGHQSTFGAGLKPVIIPLPEIRDKSTKFYKCKSKRTWRFPIHGGYPKIINVFFVVFLMFHYLNHPAIGIRPHLWKPSYVRAELRIEMCGEGPVEPLEVRKLLHVCSTDCQNR